MTEMEDLSGETAVGVVLGSQEGPQGRLAVTTEDLAAWAGTIPWEILTNVSRRVPRFYREP